MKHLILSISAALCLVSCAETTSPKSTVANFIWKLKVLDFESAQALVSDNSKKSFTEAKLKFQSASTFQDELTKSKFLNKEHISKEYGLDQLDETIAGNNAVVFSKDSTSNIKVEKVDGSWKVICTKDLVEGILFENRNLEIVKSSFKFLRQQFDARTTWIISTISSTQSENANAIRQKITEIGNIGDDISNVSTYGVKQNELTELILNILPTTTSSMNRTIELETTENNITLARKFYQDAVLEHNRGFGRKINYFPVNVNVRPVQVEF